MPARLAIPLPRLWDRVGLWRRLAAVLAVIALALFVAAIVKRPPPDFSNRPVVAVLRDAAGRPAWAIRLARAAREIAAEALRAEPAPAGRGYELWLVPPGATQPRSLGVLPASGRRLIPLTPQNARLLAGAGRLIVTLETAEGPAGPKPGGPALFRGRLGAGRAHGN